MVAVVSQKMITCVKLAQLAKAYSPTLVTEAGMAMLVKFVDANAAFPMLWSRLPLAKVMLVKAEHPRKVLSAMLVRDSGMTTFPATTSAHPKPAPMETSCKSSMPSNPRRSLDEPPTARLLWGTHGASAAHEPVIERALGTEGVA